MERDKIMELLAGHPIAKELIAREEADNTEKRKISITKRFELLDRLAKESKEKSMKVEAAKKKLDDAHAILIITQRTYEAVVLERRQAIGAIEREISRTEGFLKDTASPVIESFARGLQTIAEIIRSKSNGQNAQVNQSQETNIFTEVKTITINSTFEAAKEKMTYVRDALKRVSLLYLVPHDEAERIIEEISNQFPDEGRRVDDLENREVTFTPSKWVPTRTILNKGPDKLPSWLS